MVIDRVKYSLRALTSSLTTPMFSLSWLLSSFFSSAVNRLAHLNLTRDESGYVRSLSYDPVSVWPRTR